MSLPKESAPRQTSGLGASGHPRKLTQLTAKEAELKAALFARGGHLPKEGLAV
jgi:hypothetical protein